MSDIRSLVIGVGGNLIFWVMTYLFAQPVLAAVPDLLGFQPGWYIDLYGNPLLVLIILLLTAGAGVLLWARYYRSAICGLLAAFLVWIVPYVVMLASGRYSNIVGEFMFVALHVLLLSPPLWLLLLVISYLWRE